MRLRMLKPDRESLTKPSTSRQVPGRGTKSRGGQTFRGRHKSYNSSYGELQQKIRELQRELAKARMGEKRGKVGNHPEGAGPLRAGLRSLSLKVKTALSTNSSSNNIPLRRTKSDAKYVETLNPRVVMKPPVPPPWEDQWIPVYKNKVHKKPQVERALVGNTSHLFPNGGSRMQNPHLVKFGNSPTTPKPDVITVTPRLSASSETLCTVTDVGGNQSGTVLSGLPIKFSATHRTGSYPDYNKPKRADDPEAVKPTKTLTYAPIETMKCRTDSRMRVRRVQRTQAHYADCDLVHLLRLEYAFKPRTGNMLSQMAAKARQHLAKYDCTDLTAKDQYNLVISAVSAAMEISPLEEQVRQSLRNPEGNMARHKQARLVRDGIIGNKLFRKPDQLPSNK